MSACFAWSRLMNGVLVDLSIVWTVFLRVTLI